MRFDQLNDFVTFYILNLSLQVTFEQLNDFMCPHCDQYNGWDGEGNSRRHLLPGSASRLNLLFSISSDNYIQSDNGEETI